MSERQTTPTEHQMFDDLHWGETASDVQQHVGKLVVIHKKRVIAVGLDQDALLRQAAAKENCLEEELVVIAVPSNDLHEIPH